ncbi:Uncharacterised protein [Vibrio cholerae]|uniref:Uncharacterized protein n=1 Tax=Vibrio cholerae TaxID=666 RepID=A0A655XMN9_VIBCL|nr:Uncharacterised protein [Vibrio cholerae]
MSRLPQSKYALKTLHPLVIPKLPAASSSKGIFAKLPLITRQHTFISQ